MAAELKDRQDYKKNAGMTLWGIANGLILGLSLSSLRAERIVSPQDGTDLNFNETLTWVAWICFVFAFLVNGSLFASLRTELEQRKARLLLSALFIVQIVLLVIPLVRARI